ncbi:MAG: hypothetical protein AAB074_02250 [Planctomycetota bacterium]
MNNDASPVPTRDLCQRAGVSRNVLTRLREQYPDRIHAPFHVGNSLAWSPETVSQVRALLAEEARRSAGERS